MNFWKEFKIRLKSDSPRFFRQLRKFCAANVLALFTAYVTISTELVKLPPKATYWITTVLSYLIVAFIVVGGVTHLPTVDTDVIKENAKDKIKEETIEETKDAIADEVINTPTRTIRKRIDKNK